MRISKACRLISSAVADASSFVYSFVHGVKPFAHNLTFLDSDVVHVHLAVRLRGLALHPLGDGDDLLGLGHESLSVLGLRVEASNRITAEFLGKDATCERVVCGEKIFKERRNAIMNYFTFIH